MNAVPGLLKDIDLHAYVDGELSEAEAREVEVRLATDAKARLVIAQLLRQQRALDDKFALKTDCPKTKEMAASILRPPDNRRAKLALLSAVVAGALATGYFARELAAPLRQLRPSEPTFARTALGAHAVYMPEVRHPVEVTANDEKHLITWLSKRLGTPVRAPKLTDYGWSLVGGRLLADGDRPAAQFMYDDKTGRRMTLFVRASTGLDDRAIQFAGDDKIASYYWVDGAVGYALTGAIERRDLAILARTVHSALSAYGPGVGPDPAPDAKK